MPIPRGGMPAICGICKCCIPEGIPIADMLIPVLMDIICQTITKSRRTPFKSKCLNMISRRNRVNLQF
jgi:hypothetical protein